MRLTVSDRENLRAAIQNYTVNQPGAKKFEIVNYFLKQGYSRSTIFKNIARLAASHAIKDKKKTGRTTAWTKARSKRLHTHPNNKFGLS